MKIELCESRKLHGKLLEILAGLDAEAEEDIADILVKEHNFDRKTAEVIVSAIGLIRKEL